MYESLVQAKDHVYHRIMRILLGALGVLALVSCDPPPPQYPQYRYGNGGPVQGEPNPPPAYSNDPNAPPSTYPQNQPPPQYTTATPQPGYTSTVPPPGYTSPAAPEPGYTSTAPPASSSPTPGLPPPPAGAPAMPPPESGSSIASGQYTCWQVGMGGYVASTLVSINLNGDGSYQVAGYNNAGGTYRMDTVAVYLSGGPLNGWVGAIGANAKGPLVRFRPEAPNNPGREMHQGDHLCFLHF
jgi:hypothetical protein